MISPEQWHKRLNLILEAEEPDEAQIRNLHTFLDAVLNFSDTHQWREGIPAEWQPVCPYCKVQPCRLSIISGLDPSQGYFLIEVTCAKCHKLLPVIAMPTIAPQTQPEPPADPATKPFAVPPSKLWTPS